MPARVRVVLPRNRTITATISPEDVPIALDTVIALAREATGDGPIAYSGCLDPEDADAIAQRLARMILSELTG
jgi:hypothetical protein